MKKIIIELPDRAAKEIGRYVQAGWFPSEGEAVRAAAIDFVRHHRIEVVDHILSRTRTVEATRRIHAQSSGWVLSDSADLIREDRER